MEQELNPDRFESDANSAENRTDPRDSPTAKSEPSDRGGATDIFGTISAPPATEWSTVPEISTSTPPPPQIPPVQEPAMSRTPLPVVHEVIFKANPSSDGSDPLRQLLRSAPPIPRPADPVQTASASEAPVAAASSSGFTQLLRALNYEQPKPVEAAPAPVAPAPVPPPVAIGSITQLLRMIDQPEKPKETMPPVAPVALVERGTVVETTVQAAIRALEEARPVSTPQMASSGIQVTSFQQEVLSPVAPPVIVPVETKAVVFSEPAPSAPTGNVGFTQMFEAIGAPATAIPQPAVESQLLVASPVEPVVALPTQTVAAPGSFTQMFQTLAAPAPAETSRVEAGNTSASFPAVQDSLDVSSVETVKSDPPAPASFTQLFQSSVAAPPPSEFARAEAHATPNLPPATASSGSFTQMFRSLDAQPPASPAVAESRVESALPAAAPGSFTQMFSTPAPSSAVESRLQEAPTAATPGSFTQMFRSLDAQPADVPRAQTPPASTGSGTPGAFTQMFSTLSSPKEETPPARAEAGSFTQLFGTLSDSPSPGQPVLSAPPFESPRASTPDFGSGASQVFATQQNTKEPERGPAFSPSNDPGFASSAVQSQPTAPAGGGLTQLLRTLDHSPQPAAPTEPLWPAASQQPGAFTSACSNLEPGGSYQQPAAAPPQSFAQPSPVDNRDATQAFRSPTAPAPPTAPSVSAGPSEFTRILNASMFRENVLRGGEVAPTPPIAQSPGAGGFPPMAMPPLTPPAMPSGGGASPTPQWAMPAAPSAPAVPQMPQVKAPEIPKPAAPAAGKMQQMLPLLLILIIFLLVAVLVAVVILMKH